MSGALTPEADNDEDRPAAAAPGRRNPSLDDRIHEQKLAVARAVVARRRSALAILSD